MYKDITIDESLPSYSSGIVDFTKQQRFSVLAALGELGVIATTDDANTQNGEKFIPFYDDYLSRKPGMVTIYKVYDDGLIGSNTFLYRDDEIQSYYVGVKPGADGQPCISGKIVKEITTINYTSKGYFIYEDKNPMLHASAFGYYSDYSDVTPKSLPVKDFMLYCYEDSKAEKYAKENGIKYTLLAKSKRGWQKENEIWYYLKADGYMAANMSMLQTVRRRIGWEATEG